MFCAGDEFCNTQLGNNNPYNQDNETTWLDWDLVERNAEVLRFFRLMIAFRKSHPTIARGRFWRDDVSWYGADGAVDTSYESRSVAYCLSGASEADVGMIAGDEAGQPVVVGEVRVEDVEAVLVHEALDGVDAAHERHRVLRPLDDGMREVVMPDLRLQLVAADVGVVRVDPRRAQGLDFGERRCGGAGPAVSGGEMEDSHA